jgi:hypothetical protein
VLSVLDPSLRLPDGPGLLAALAAQAAQAVAAP